MKISDFIKVPKSFYFIVAGLGLLNSFLNIGILLFINSYIQGKGFPIAGKYAPAVFLSLVISTFLINKFFQHYIIRIVNNFIYDYELEILDKLRNSNLSDFNKIGAERVYATIEDTKVLMHIPPVLTNTVNSVISIIVCLFYFFIVSPIGALGLLAIIVSIIVVYNKRNKSVLEVRRKVRGFNDVYFGLVGDMLFGFKELKMNSKRNGKLFKKIHENRMQAKELDILTSKKFLTNGLIGQYGWYIIVAFIIFGLPNMITISSASIASLIIIFLFILGPINMLMSLESYFSEVSVAKNRIENFLADISFMSYKEGKEITESLPDKFDQIIFKDVIYEYFDEDNQNRFTLGPINLTIEEGETIFIIGGNGSGKSTFMNLLSGLTKPSSGTININNHDLTETDYPKYRNLISAIFTNHHLFSNNYEDYELKDNTEFNKLIDLMELEDIIDKDNITGISKKLSKGQEKRLAMIFAIMEKRPILILDEWAAEQDPYFKKYFYEELVLKFKLERKTIIAITHDDAYFEHCDRIIKFEYGNVIKDYYVKEAKEKITFYN
ncbi:ATP-binding cassette domain-containing protein [Flavobacterium sp.]|uniref:ATP-binding cassette domain-containing protein n=1 Tax=Flavobacterium sp. TaxID=239 RepID=UPI003D6C34F0